MHNDETFFQFVTVALYGVMNVHSLMKTNCFHLHEASFELFIT